VVAFLSSLYRRRGLVLGVAMALAAVSAWGASGVGIDNRLGIWFSPSDSTSVQYERFRQGFGTDETVILVYRSDSLFSAGELRLNALLTDRLQRVPHVQGVLSISTLEVPRLSFTGPVMVPLIPRAPVDPETLRAQVLGKKTLRDNVVSEDGTATGFALTLDTQDDQVRLQVLDSIRDLVTRPPFHIHTYELVGNIPIRAEMNRVSTAESGRFVGIAILVMMGLLWIYFSSFTAAAAAVSVSILTVLVTLGLFSAMGYTLNMVAGILPLILLVVSLSVSVHIISRVDAVSARGSSQRGLDAQGVEPWREGTIGPALGPILEPCLLAALTTAAAFSSFLFSGIGPLRVFGAFCSFGVLLSFALAFLLVPLILTLSPRFRGPPRGAGFLDLGPALEGLAQRVVRHRGLVFLASGFVLAAALLGLQRLTFETDQIQYLQKRNPIRVANDLAQEWFAGVYPLEVVLELSDSVQERPGFYLTLLTRMEERIQALPDVAVVHSAATGIRDFLPDGPLRAIALTSLARREVRDESGDGETVRGFRYLSSTGTMARLSVKARWMNNEETLILLSDLDRILAPLASEGGLTFYYTGVVPMFVSINQRLTRSQISSFLLSFALIFLLFLLFFRKPSLATVGMIPNVLPVLTTVGIMGWMGVPMDVATVLIAAISLGIAVDDTIHLMWAYSERKEAGLPPLQSLNSAIRAVGRPLVLTSLILVAGFLTMVFSTYLPVLFLGVFVSLNVFLAILFDLTLLPAALSALERA